MKYLYFDSYFGLIAALTCIFAIMSSASPADDMLPCKIEVVEQETGWPIPLVQMRTTHNALIVTDNAGRISFNDPDIMGQTVFFHVEGHGYEAMKDGFGYYGVKLTPRPGKTIRVELKRTIIARRLGRLTGTGLFVHSQDMTQVTTSNQSYVVGCDSVQATYYRGRLFWLWGDTTLVDYPLGIFHSSGATTERKPLDSFQPPLQVQFKYFQDDKGKVRSIARLSGEGLTWLSGLTTVTDRSEKERLVATYSKIHPPLSEYETGLCVWNDELENFEKLKTIWKETDEHSTAPPIPQGHSVRWKDVDGKDWILFGNPLPTLRCRATLEAWQDETQWDLIQPQKTIRSAHDGQAIEPHSGSVAWNSYRNRWVTVFMQRFGKPSTFGEIWYAEADVPTGPWGPAVKILSHNNYTFYNPKIHPELTAVDSPVLLFEGTYTQQFADNPFPTPRYDYNQILYRLDFDDPRLRLARSVNANSSMVE